MHNLLFVRLLLEQKNKRGRPEWANACKNLLLPFKVEDFGEDPICI
jgi:hypothetical protein